MSHRPFNVFKTKLVVRFFKATPPHSPQYFSRLASAVFAVGLLNSSMLSNSTACAAALATQPEIKGVWLRYFERRTTRFSKSRTKACDCGTARLWTNTV
jgi:hypothetical protein